MKMIRANCKGFKKAQERCFENGKGGKTMLAT